MAKWWPAIVFGWPAIIGAIGLSIAGILRNKPLWLVAAAIITAPYSFYLAGSPTYGWVALLLSPMLIVGSILVKYRRAAIAWFCLVPFVGVTGWLARVVINQ